MNKVILMGNITQDIEVKVTQGGSKVMQVGFATNESYTKDGEKKQHTEYHNLVAWEKKAEFFETYVTKGMKLLIEGKLQTQSWEGDDGKKRYKTNILVSSVEFCGKKSEESKQAQKTPNEPLCVDDLPF